MQEHQVQALLVNKMKDHNLIADAIVLLETLISIPSPSRHEDKTADAIQVFFQQRKIAVRRSQNNIWCSNKFFNASLPSLLLNSHHDTVAPNAQYKNNPYQPIQKDGKLFGLGSTDAGASLVSLLAAFLKYYDAENLPYNIVFAATAEEEISGVNGISSLLEIEEFKNYFIHKDSVAIIGEPTELELAIAEKGLLVLDCIVHGKPGHAARDDGENAIYKAIKAIDWFRHYVFEKKSEWLGEVKMTVTSISTENITHNIIPASCNFVVDIRVTDVYTHEEILQTIKEHVDAEIKPRSMRLRSSLINESHPLVHPGITLGKKCYGSPTSSDKGLIPLPALKCGPGSSVQSHSADEFILIKDIEAGILFYIELMNAFFNTEL
ncbi:MAG: M20/M25/M40 family metallo-hydrolase [Ferruginibacter sp.]